VSPAGEREESDHFSGGEAADARAKRIREVPGNEAFPGQSVTGDEAVAGFIPVPFDPNRSRPSVSAALRRDEPLFTKSGKPLRKIRQDGLPVLAVKFPGAWALLASRPADEKWWSFARRARTYFEADNAPDGACLP